MTRHKSHQQNKPISDRLLQPVAWRLQKRARLDQRRLVSQRMRDATTDTTRAVREYLRGHKLIACNKTEMRIGSQQAHALSKTKCLPSVTQTTFLLTDKTQKKSVDLLATCAPITATSSLSDAHGSHPRKLVCPQSDAPNSQSSYKDLTKLPSQLGI